MQVFDLLKTIQCDSYQIKSKYFMMIASLILTLFNPTSCRLGSFVVGRHSCDTSYLTDISEIPWITIYPFVTDTTFNVACNARCLLLINDHVEKVNKAVSQNKIRVVIDHGRFPFDEVI